MKQFLKSLFLFACLGLLILPQFADAVTFYNVSDELFIQTSPLIVQGKVGFIESRKADNGGIFTLIRIDVTDVLKGALTQNQLLLKQAGGQVGNEGEIFYGLPEFKLNENVIVLLNQRGDSYYEITGLAMGKFSMLTDAANHAFLQRKLDQVTVLAGPDFQKAPVGNTMSVDDLKQKINNSLQPGASQPGVGNQPSAQYLADLETSHSRPSVGYSFMGPYRYFPTQPDGSTLYQMQINPANNPFGNATTAQNALQAGFDAWNHNVTSSIAVNISGTTTAGGMDADDTVSFNDPNHEISPDPSPSYCGGVLGMGGSSYYGNTMVVNGQTFYKAVAGRITFNNGWTAAEGCAFLDNYDKLTEIAAHEVGHVIGLGHSADPNAMMYGMASGTKGNTLGTDDINGVSFIYPAVAAPATYTITATAGTGGAIAPNGTVTVNQGASKSFTITPNAGYRIADVKVNGASVGAVTSYTFSNVTANQTIQATFELIPPVTFIITATAGTGGTIAPNGTVTVNQGASKTFSITANAGYRIADVKVNGASVGAVTSYTFSNVTANQTIQATFELLPPLTFTITATAGTGGTIAPNGTVTVNQGANQTFTMTPNAGYEIKDVLVDNVSAGAVTTYTFTTVTANHMITVSFKAVQATVTSYFGFNQYGGTWHDAEKSPTNPDDDLLCWAAAAANILDWAGWDTPIFDSELDIFYNFQSYWTNVGGLPEYGWNWWFDGTSDSPAGSNWSQLKASDGGNYWSSYNFFDYFKEDWAWNSASGAWGDGTGIMASLDNYLRSGYGTALAIYTGDAGHALTAWGCEYDDAGNYTGIWVTDSDDYSAQMKLLSVTLDAAQGLWNLGGDYAGWFIGGVEALARRPEIPNPSVPEPGTLFLIGIGVVGLMAIKRIRR